MPFDRDRQDSRGGRPRGRRKKQRHKFFEFQHFHLKSSLKRKNAPCFNGASSDKDIKF